MGHAYGLEHACLAPESGGTFDDYGDKWDVMGRGWHYFDKVFGIDAPGLIVPMVALALALVLPTSTPLVGSQR